MLKSYLSKLCAFSLLLGMSFGAFAQNVTVTAPASVAGEYPSIHAAFGGWLNGQSAELVLADDGAGSTLGCTITNDMTGKIALVDRGTCGFAVKANNAQNAGAIAVIICNSLAGSAGNLDSIFLAGGTNCAVTIPATMLSYNSCTTIKAALATGPVSVSLATNYPGDGNGIQAEIELPGAGTYTVDTLVGQQLFTDAGSAKYFKITATSDAVMNVNSCLGGADTRVTVLQGCRNGVTAASILGQNEDFCELEPGGDEYASSVDVIVYAGEEYLIVWDSTFSASGFDFSVSFGSLPTVAATFNVNMQEEVVAGDGVKITINGGPELPMTNTGGSIYSYTQDFTAGEFVEVVFLNGSGNPEDSLVQVTCRTFQVGLEPGATIPYCFNDCAICPPQTSCPSPNAILCDDFDDYAAGSTTGTNAPFWSTWSGTTGGAEDGIVSDVEALSVPNSMLITTGGAQDVLLLLGDLTSGSYALSWNMYIPAGKTAYYNIQEDETPAVAWNLDVAFGTNLLNPPAQTPGIGVARQNSIDVNFDVTYDKWFKVRHLIDLDNDEASLFIDGKLITSWAYTGNIGSVDFYSLAAATSTFYVDDVLFETNPGDVCISAYDLDSYLGGGQDVLVSTPLFDNTNYYTDPSDPDAG